MPFQPGTDVWSQERDYSELMREMWGSPSRWNVRKSYADVAAKLGIDEETVRNRLKRMREGGFLLGWRLFPNPRLLDRESVFLYMSLKIPGHSDDAVKLLAACEGVVTITKLLGNNLLVMVMDDPDHRSVKEIENLAIHESTMIAPGMKLPDTSFQMTSLDWRIVATMGRNAEMPVTETASELGISARTVKNRLNRMMDSSAIFIMPLTDVSKTVGVAYQLIVESREGMLAEVDSMVSRRIGNVVFRALDSTRNIIFGFTGKNLAEGSQIEKWIRKLPEVRSARLNVVEEVIYVFEWLDEEAGRRAASMREQIRKQERH